MLVRFERGKIKVREEACIQEEEERKKRKKRKKRNRRKKRTKRKRLRRITFIVKATLSSSVTGSRLFLSRLQQTHLIEQDHGAFYPAVPGTLRYSVRAQKKESEENYMNRTLW